MISPYIIFLYSWGMKAWDSLVLAKHSLTESPPAFSILTLLLLVHFSFPKRCCPHSTARPQSGCPVLRTRLSLTEARVSDKPVQKPPVSRAIEQVFPVGVFLKLAISPSKSLIETLHREAAEGACYSKHRRTLSPWGPGASISPMAGTTLCHTRSSPWAS